jgi:5-methylcytosine-specific restriction protein A
MALSPKTICPGAGCNRIVPIGERCERHRQQDKRQRWKQADERRGTTAERGYGSRWQEASEGYRSAHALCVPCLLQDRVTATRCVDHIVPRHCCEELFWDSDNWCSMCNRCHARKTRKEPKASWVPDRKRIVICGLPGTGKTTAAKAIGLPYWDADDYPWLTIAESIERERGGWMARHSGPCVVIVASPVTAATLAARMQGMVRHMTTQYVSRAARALAL